MEHYWFNGWLYSNLQKDESVQNMDGSSMVFLPYFPFQLLKIAIFWRENLHRFLHGSPIPLNNGAIL